MFELHNQAASARLFIMESFGNGVDGPGRNLRGCKCCQPLSCWLLMKNILQQRHKRFPVSDSLRVCGKSLVRSNACLNVHNLNEALPQCVSSYPDDKILIIVCAENFIRHDVWMSVAPAFWGNAGIQVAAPSVRQPGKLRIE